jgi:hypothetical protein
MNPFETLSQAYTLGPMTAFARSVPEDPRIQPPQIACELSTALREAIVARRKELLRNLHPDIFATAPSVLRAQAERLFKEVEAAADLLLNPAKCMAWLNDYLGRKRAEHDRTRASSGSSAGASGSPPKADNASGPSHAGSRPHYENQYENVEWYWDYLGARWVCVRRPHGLGVRPPSPQNDPGCCGAETDYGTPCTRPPSAGRRRCWQHKGRHGM